MTEYFKNWVKRMVNSFNAKDDYRGARRKRKMIVTNVVTGKRGIAKCNKTDCFDTNIGVAIAYARCIGKPVPDMDFEPINKNKKYHFFKYNKYTHKVVNNEYCTCKQLNTYGITKDQTCIETSIRNSDSNSYVYENSECYLIVISNNY